MSSIKKKIKKPSKSKDLWLKQLGLKVKEFRLEKGMSQADLAYSIHMDAQNISRIERGMVSPSAFAIKQICDSIGMPMSEFYASF